MPWHTGPGSEEQARVRLGRQPRRYGEQKTQDGNREDQTPFHSAHEVAPARQAAWSFPPAPQSRKTPICLPRPLGFEAHLEITKSPDEGLIAQKPGSIGRAGN